MSAAGKAIAAFSREAGRRTTIALDACVRCGHCAEACQFYLADRDPRHTPIWKLEPFRRAWRREAGPFAPLYRLFTPEVAPEELERWQELLYDTCTMCGRCTAACPMGIDIAALVGAARHAMFQAGLVPPDLQRVAERAEREGSPLGATPTVLRERLEWLSDEHGVPIPLDLARADVLLTVSSIEVMKYPLSLVAAARVMQHAGVSWMLSTHGYEATNFAMLSGDRDGQRSLTHRLVAAAEACGAKTVVLPECGHAYGALRWEGANAIGRELPFRVLHMSEFLAEELDAGRLRVKPIATSTAFHDPCQVSRRGGAAGAPRRVLHKLGLVPIEMPDAAELGLCCGGGGGVIAIGRAAGLRRRATAMRLEELEATGAEYALTSCANCRQSFDDAARERPGSRTVGSLVELVAERLVAPAAT